MDCAIALLDGCPKGFSWQVDSVWKGTPDASGILIDFSAAKRLIRETIDSDFDHRLLLSPGQISKRKLGPQRILVTTPWQKGNEKGSLFLNCPLESTAIIDETCLTDDANGVRNLEAHLARAIQARAPGNIASIEIKLRNSQEKCESFFNYIHALPFHLGNCQRFHGHSSRLEVIQNNTPDPHLSNQIAGQLDGRFCLAKKFVTRDLSNPAFVPIVEEVTALNIPVSQLAFALFTGTQGEVALAVPEWALLELPDESTIENMAEFIKATFLRDKPDAKVIVYEGLQKGAMSS
jgi:6-pyruvoyl-tetrahydropterin synthase